MKKKVCTLCKGSFPESDNYFYYQSKKLNRFQGRCKKCTNKLKAERLKKKVKPLDEAIAVWQGGDEIYC